MTTTVIYGTRARPGSPTPRLTGADSGSPSPTSRERRAGSGSREASASARSVSRFPPGSSGSTSAPGRIDLAAFAEYLGQPAVADAAHGVWAFGPATSPAAPPSVEAPDFTLPDIEGNMHSLTDYNRLSREKGAPLLLGLLARLPPRPAGLAGHLRGDPGQGVRHPRHRVGHRGRSRRPRVYPPRGGWRHAASDPGHHGAGTRSSRSGPACRRIRA